MITRRKLLIVLSLGPLLTALSAQAQQQTKVWRIGYLHPGTPIPEAVFNRAFIQGMRELGYIEGKNYVIEWRYAEGKNERLAGLVAELVRLKVDVIVATGNAAIGAAQQATTTTPIVSPITIDPVGAGFAKSLGRPGGNITGLTPPAEQLPVKHLELLKTAVPRLSRVALLLNPGNPFHGAALKNVQAAAQQLGVKLVPEEARKPEDIERAFAMMVRERVDAVIVLADPVLLDQRRQIAEVAIKHRLPSIYALREHADAGGYLSYAANIVDHYRRAATYVAKILKGAKPADLPIEQPTMLYLVINRKAAKALGLTISQELLLRADEVIE